MEEYITEYAQSNNIDLSGLIDDMKQRFLFVVAVEETETEWILYHMGDLDVNNIVDAIKDNPC